MDETPAKQHPLVPILATVSILAFIQFLLNRYSQRKKQRQQQEQEKQEKKKGLLRDGSTLDNARQDDDRRRFIQNNNQNKSSVKKDTQNMVHWKKQKLQSLCFWSTTILIILVLVFVLYLFFDTSFFKFLVAHSQSMLDNISNNIW